jgi:hypothetical protein
MLAAINDFITELVEHIKSRRFDCIFWSPSNHIRLGFANMKLTFGALLVTSAAFSTSYAQCPDYTGYSQVNQI